MPNKTTKLGLNTFLESEVLNYEDVNYNFEKIDEYPICIESGKKSSTYSGAVSGNATWYYRKYSDGTIDLYTNIETTGLKCSSGASAPYHSNTTKILIPISLSTIYGTELSLTSEYLGWVADITGKNVNDYITFQVVGLKVESNNTYKRVYIHIKGRC